MIEDRTREILGAPAGIALSFQAIVEGGSARSFHRARVEGGSSCVVMRYGSEKEENLYYVEIAEFLRELGLNVPRVLLHDAAAHLAWMEDLGPADLFALRDRPWEERQRGYRATLEQTHRLHDKGLAALERTSSKVRLMGGFDSALYSWERGYFVEQFVKGACGIELHADEARSLELELEGLAQTLLAQPPVLVHRDLQSKNVMLRGGGAYLIDFQGLRRGVAAYDLGSLLFDPYVPFRDAERLALLEDYYALGSALSWEALRQGFFQGAVQRLMQALGAYGFLGLRQEKPEFLRHIPAGLNHLEQAARQLGELPSLESLIARVRSEAPRSLIEEANQ